MTIKQLWKNLARGAESLLECAGRFARELDYGEHEVKKELKEPYWARQRRKRLTREFVF